MGRFIVVVIDSFGIGAMDDVKDTRPQDLDANTCKHILQNYEELELSNLEKLGLINALGEKVNKMDFSPTANFGSSKLMHFGGDTFFGHQEIMGTLPKEPLVQPFSEVIDEVAAALLKEGHKVEYIGEGLKYLVVDDSLTIGDNLEADLGQVYNLTAALDIIAFEDLLLIGKKVRQVAKVARVISFGGRGIGIRDIKGAKEEKLGKYIGINAPKSGVYNSGYQVRHMGYGIDKDTQVQTLLYEKNIPAILIGKVADIVDNPLGLSYEGIVDTHKVFEIALDEINKNKNAFFCINIQETDLAGHREDVDWYADRLKVTDSYIGNIIDTLNKDDILIITADHGNDPTIGHSKHTRENVPLLVYKKGLESVKIGRRDTLSDIAASAAEYFDVSFPENGRSFLKKIIKSSI